MTANFSKKTFLKTSGHPSLKPGLLDQEYLRMHSNDSCLNDEIEGYYYGKNYELMGKVFIFLNCFIFKERQFSKYLKPFLTNLRNGDVESVGKNPLKESDRTLPENQIGSNQTSNYSPESESD